MKRTTRTLGNVDRGRQTCYEIERFPLPDAAGFLPSLSSSENQAPYVPSAGAFCCTGSLKVINKPKESVTIADRDGVEVSRSILSLLPDSEKRQLRRQRLNGRGVVITTHDPYTHTQGMYTFGNT